MYGGQLFFYFLNLFFKVSKVSVTTVFRPALYVKKWRNVAGATSVTVYKPTPPKPLQTVGFVDDYILSD